MELFEITDVEEIKPIRKGNKEIMVSIWCLTYNHEKYIRDTFEGILSQNVIFDYEIVVFDDASIDNTTEVIREYATRYPEKFHVFLLKKNIFKHSNRIEIINNIRKKYLKGKYVAFCEGDDYWIDTHKLQLQVDYMENHPNCSLTIHDAVMVNYKTNEINSRRTFYADHNLTAEEVIMQSNGFITTASMVCRREMAELQGCFVKAGVGDYPIHLHALCKGDIHYSSRIMAVYRYLHSGSYGASLRSGAALSHAIKLINFLHHYNEYTDSVYEQVIEKKIQEFARYVLHNYKDCTLEQFDEICTSFDMDTQQEYHTIIEEIRRLYHMVYDKNYCDDRFDAVIRKYKKIAIFGAGEFGQIIERQLGERQIDFKGFVVSNGRKNIEEYLGKEVWELDKIPFKKEEMLFIVAVYSNIWDDIKNALEQAQIENYICPFMIRI